MEIIANTENEVEIVLDGVCYYWEWRTENGMRTAINISLANPGDLAYRPAKESDLPARFWEVVENW